MPISAGCWLEQFHMAPSECVENGGVIFTGKCYAAALPPPKRPQPTSSPPEAR